MAAPSWHCAISSSSDMFPGRIISTAWRTTTRGLR